MSCIMQAEPSVSRTPAAAHSTALLLCQEQAVVTFVTLPCILSPCTIIWFPRVLGGGGASGSKSPVTIEVSESRDVCESDGGCPCIVIQCG